LAQNENIVEQPAVLTSLTQRLTDYATDFIIRQTSAGQPFFLYLAYHHVHYPQFAGPAFRNSSRRGSFGDSVAEVDHSVGQLLTLLTELGMRNDTMILFTSDNGPELLEEGGGGQSGSPGLFRCGKGTTWEGGHRVPALVSWPGGRVLAGRVPELVSAMDMLPTLVSMATGSTHLLTHLELDGYDIRQFFCILAF
jgi:arylsulfatase A